MASVTVMRRAVERLERDAAPPPEPLVLAPLDLAAAVGLQLDPWQRDALTAPWQRALWNCSRQSGKSTTAALLGLHTALTTPGTLVLLLAAALRQAQELFRKVTTAYEALRRPVPADAQSALRLELEGGSRIVALPGTERTIRGYSGVVLLIVDEAARVPDDLYYSVRPMLAVSGGRLVAMSTPFGRRGWWHDAWVNGGDGWARVEVPATACPRISPQFLADEQASLPAWVYRQEYEGSFEETDTTVFAYSDIQAALVDGDPLWPTP
jgi:hypothetical protein